MNLFASEAPDWVSRVWGLAGASVLVCAIGALFLKARSFIKHTVSKELADPSVVEALSLLVKPDLVFDENGSVLSDRGASAFIRDGGIHVTKDTSSDPDSRGLPIKIRVAFAKHLRTAPMLSSLNPDAVFIFSDRGSGFEWVYTLEYSMITTPPSTRAVARRYRLEIV
ncbi:MAG: hypothetical protein HQ582_24260 [Planctomycetes bacterium]|nr:hypothetical protein [Planctomycetota bacterium]